MNQIKESDWKLFRTLRPIALNRYCQRVLEDTSRILAASDQTAHQKYLAVYKLIDERDKDIEQTFNDLRRSTAALRLAMMMRLDLITEEELKAFSEEMQDRLKWNWS